MMGWSVNKELESVRGIGRGLRRFQAIVRRPRKTSLSIHDRSPSRDVNAGPPEYEALVRSTRLRLSVNKRFLYSCLLQFSECVSVLLSTISVTLRRFNASLMSPFLFLSVVLASCYISKKFHFTSLKYLCLSPCLTIFFARARPYKTLIT
jgi:hypothetical protein